MVPPPSPASTQLGAQTTSTIEAELERLEVWYAALPEQAQAELEELAELDERYGGDFAREQAERGPGAPPGKR
jgi:hypothetical protein